MTSHVVGIEPVFGHPLRLHLEAVDLAQQLVVGAVDVHVDEDVVEQVAVHVLHLARLLDDLAQLLVLKHRPRIARNVLFNNALNTFYLQLYGVGHMVNHKPRVARNVLFNNALNTFYLRLYGIGHMVNHKPRVARNVLFNNALNTFYLRLYGVGHMVNHKPLVARKETSYLTTHSTQFIYGYMVSDIW